MCVFYRFCLALAHNNLILTIYTTDDSQHRYYQLCYSCSENSDGFISPHCSVPDSYVLLRGDTLKNPWLAPAIATRVPPFQQQASLLIQGKYYSFSIILEFKAQVSNSWINSHAVWRLKGKCFQVGEKTMLLVYRIYI